MINKVTHRRSSLFCACHRLGAGGDRLNDIVIAGATADVALEFFTDRCLIRLAPSTHDIKCHHHHARGAVAALKAVILTKSRLHRVEGGLGRGQSLNGGDRRALALERGHGARFYRYAIDMHDTRAALRCVATDVRACELEPLPEKVDERRSPFDRAV